jgi:hypothetical protein
MYKISRRRADSLVQVASAYFKATRRRLPVGAVLFYRNADDFGGRLGDAAHELEELGCAEGHLKRKRDAYATLNFRGAESDEAKSGASLC